MKMDRHLAKFAFIVSASLCAFGLMAASAFGENTTMDGIYRGTAGTEEIVLEMGWIGGRYTEEGFRPSHIEGRYFYRLEGTPVPLDSETQPDGSILLKEYTTNDHEPSAEWKLTVHGDTATGVLCHCHLSPAAATGTKGGGEVPSILVSLTRVSKAFYPPMDVPGYSYGPPPDQLYYDLLLDSPLLNGDEVRVSDSIAYILQTDPRYKVAMPHIVRFPDKMVMEKVNHTLSQALDGHRLAAADCSYNSRRQPPRSPAEWEDTVRVTLFTSQVLSVIHSIHSNCGRGDGSLIHWHDSLIFDLRIGKQFDFKDFFTDLFHKYEGKTLLLDLWERYKPKRSDCKIDTADWPFLRLDKEGLAIQPQVGRADDRCAPEAIIPYPAISDLVRRKDLLRSVMSNDVGSASIAPPGEAGEPKPWSTRVNSRDGLVYVWIYPGTFQMGCSPGDKECSDDEKPAHWVTLTKGFWLGQTPVTQAAYQRVTGANPSQFKGEQLPVDQVTWGDAISYCSAVGMRLPTEAEWEYAARAGSTASRYGDINAIAWDANSDLRTHAVAQKQPNAWKLYDMLGNVWQWTADWYDGHYYSQSSQASYSGSPQQDPTGPSSGRTPTVRGGSSDSLPAQVRVSFRYAHLDPDYGFYALGFRCVGQALP